MIANKNETPLELVNQKRLPGKKIWHHATKKTKLWQKQVLSQRQGHMAFPSPSPAAHTFSHLRDRSRRNKREVEEAYLSIV